MTASDKQSSKALINKNSTEIKEEANKMGKIKESITKKSKTFGNYCLKFKPGRSNDEYNTEGYAKRRNSHCCPVFFI